MARNEHSLVRTGRINISLSADEVADETIPSVSIKSTDRIITLARLFHRTRGPDV